MYERMPDKSTMPTMDEMVAYCDERAPLFAALNMWIAEALQTQQKIVFPYGNSYGWGVSHKKKSKLI